MPLPMLYKAYDSVLQYHLKDLKDFNRLHHLIILLMSDLDPAYQLTIPQSPC